MLRVHYLMQDLAKMSIIFKYATATNASPLTIDLFLFYKVLNLSPLQLFKVILLI